MPGTLALVGSGEYLPPMNPVDRFLLDRLGGPARVVCLPTAAGQEGPDRIAYWSDLGVGHFTRLGAQVESLPVIDRASADDANLVGHIRSANFVYLSGGRPDYLYNTLVGSAALAAIREVLAAGGVVAGCSAGAMIFGRRCTPFPWHRGLAALPGAIIMPHFDEISRTLEWALKLLFVPLRTLIGVDGDTALVVGEGGAVVAGSGRVTVWSLRGRRRYASGERVEIGLSVF